MSLLRASTAALLAAAALVTAGSASAVDVGVVDDFGIAPEHTEWFLSSITELGMSENRVSISWDPEAPTTIQRQHELERYVALATLRGVRVIFSVAPATARPLANTIRSDTGDHFGSLSSHWN